MCIPFATLPLYIMGSGTLQFLPRYPHAYYLFSFLTKRPSFYESFLTRNSFIYVFIYHIAEVWLGISVEGQMFDSNKSQMRVEVSISPAPGVRLPASPPPPGCQGSEAGRSNSSSSSTSCSGRRTSGLKGHGVLMLVIISSCLLVLKGKKGGGWGGAGKREREKKNSA